MGELSVVAQEQPCMIVGDFKVEPTKIPCLAKGTSAGFWVDFEASGALATGLQPSPTCKRDWSATGVHRWDFIFGCPLAAAAIFPARFRLTDGLLLILMSGRSLIAAGGLVELRSQCSALPFGLLLGCLLLIRVGD